jgi:acyl carrier protein
MTDTASPRPATSAVLSFDAFALKLIDELFWNSGPNVSQIVPELSLTGDLSLDSLQRLEMLLVIEDLKETELDDDVLTSLETLGDAYDLYCAS